MAASIPIFTTQLEKSRDSTTLSNVRAAYVPPHTENQKMAARKAAISNFSNDDSADLQ